MTNPYQLMARVRHFCSRWPQHPRNGKVARLPEAIREQINQMLDDGFRYRAIIEKLSEPGAAPLPYPLSEMNLSNWFRGGYQEWRLQQEDKALAAENAAAAQKSAAPVGTLPQRSEAAKG